MSATPLKDLARAVIKRAINDLDHKDPKLRRTARQFLFDDDVEQHLNLWSAVAEVQPEEVRKQLRERGMYE